MYASCIHGRYPGKLINSLRWLPEFRLTYHLNREIGAGMLAFREDEWLLEE